MRSKVLVAVFCAAVALIAIAPAASADVFQANLGADQVRKYHVVTDTSTILGIELTMRKPGTDIDIMVTYEDDDDEIVTLVDSVAGIDQLERVVVGVPGATRLLITVTHISGPRAKFSLLIWEFGMPDNDGPGERAGIRVTEAGEFSLSGPVAPEDMAIQALLQRHGARKGGGR